MIKVLHVEDNLNDFVLLENELKKTINDIIFKRADNEFELKKALKSFMPDIVISDYAMPGFDGMSALKICKEFNPRLPFIILTGSMNEDTAVECLKAGADDYVIKEHLMRITPAVHSSFTMQRLKIEKEKNDKALIESENRLALALEATNAGIWDLAVITKKMYFGKGFLQLLGYAENEVPDNSAEFRRMIIHQDDFEMVENLLYKHMIGHSPRYEAEYRLLKKDGNYLYVLDRGKVVEKDSNGNAVRITGTIIDITEKKKIENDLLTAKEKAEEMNRLKTNFFSNMSHEFRTPLNGILGLASILIEMIPEEEKQKMLNDIIFSGKRLQNTLDSILEYAQLDSVFNPETLHEVDLRLIVASRIKECSTLCRQKGIPVFFNSPLRPVFVDATEKYISIIVYNLLENSIKFTSQGQITVEVNSLFEDGAEWGIIKVSDTGIGILKEHQSIIFQEFRQVSEGYGRYYEGAGLGLALINKLVSLLNGCISVESEYGVGSAFTVKIPIASKSLLNERFPENKEIPHAREEDEKKRILLIEDNQVNKDVVTLFLKKICNVDFANTGERGILLARNYSYPVVMVDINLGSGMNGVEAAKEIRKIEGYANVPIIAVTGYAMHGDKEKLIAEGIDYYLAKPFEKPDLIDIVLKALK